MGNRINILMATYNGEKYIEQQICSIIDQSNQDWKLIIHDDGSTDNTIGIISKYVSEYPGKIILIDDGIKTGGPTNNFMHLIKISNAPYIMFCDQDDIWLKNKVELTLNKAIIAETKNSQIPILVHTDLVVVDDHLNKIHPSMWKSKKINTKVTSLNRLLIQNNVTGCTVMVNKALLDIYKSKKLEHQIGHDWTLAILASIYGKIFAINTQTILYRQHLNNVIGAEKNNSILLKITNKHNLKDLYVRSFIQAQEILESYKDIDKDKSILLIDYALMYKSGKLKKMYLVVKNNFYRQGLVRIMAEVFI